MMQRIYLFLLLLLPFSLSAQTYYTVTALSGTQTVGGNTVTVTTSGTGNTSTSWCGASPYWIGSAGGVGGYTFSFASSVGQIHLDMTAMNTGEIVAFYINGTHYPITTSNFTMYLPVCPGNSPVLATGGVTSSGDLTVTAGAGNGQSSGIHVDICPGYPITSFKMEHSSGASGEVVTMQFTPTTCSPVYASADTPCEGGVLHLTAQTTVTNATFSWTGPGGFSSTQQNPIRTNVSMADTGDYTVTMIDTGGAHTSTVHVTIRPKPTTPIATNNGPLCTTGTLQLSATSTGASTFKWSGPNSFSSTTQNPSITPVTSAIAGLYKVFATAANGCVSDTGYTTVVVYPKAIADYSYKIKYGCTQDTVVFTNLSTSGSYQWVFGDGSGDTAKHPTHIYITQNVYNVKLYVRSANGCRDSIAKSIDIKHPLQAAFTVSKDSICQQGSVTFGNTSTTTTINGVGPTWHWDFGDGATDNIQSPTHTYTRSGVFTTTLTVTDFVPCTSTATHVIVVDSIPFVRFTISDSSICEGQAINFLADYLHIGVRGLIWRMGDSTTIYNRDAVSHGYDGSGPYTVTLTAQYRICKDTTYTRTIDVRPFPGLNIGPDTAICPNGAPILIADLTNGGNPAAAHIWSTGETTPAIMVNAPGTYWSKVSMNGCTTSDTIEVRKNCYTNIPNSFTPNGDGLNDYFYPRSLLSAGVVFFKMNIYNRWGQQIFESQNIDGRGWDGRFNGVMQNEGVYIYTIDVMYKNGVKETYKGNVTLLR